GRLDEARVVELPPLVFAAAAGGDRVARDLLDRLADEIVALVRAAIRRLRVAKREVEVVPGGGVFRSRDGLFVRRIQDGVMEVAPRASVAVLDAPPVLGAALLGLDQVGARSGAASRLRAAITHER